MVTLRVMAWAGFVGTSSKIVTRTAACAALAVLLTACGESRGDAAPDWAPVTPSDRTVALIAPDGAAVPLEPEGELAGGATVTTFVNRSPALRVEPCALLDLAVFSDHAGNRVSDHITLEHGAGCGATDEEDTLRIALMVTPHHADYRHLRADERSAAQPVTDPATGWWITGTPVPTSDQLLVEVDPGADLLVEVSDRSGIDAGKRLRLATAIASAAMEALPALISDLPDLPVEPVLPASPMQEEP